jgi:PadR family transcriptional regulator, regulatory protein PadR
MEQVADELLILTQGTLYPALVRLEQDGWIKGTWRKTDSNREEKYFGLTKAGLRGWSRKPGGGGKWQCLWTSC